MDWEKAGPLFERYAIKLVGTLDRRWVDSYAGVVSERPNLGRFRLEPATSTVSFTCRSTDGPAEVMGVVKRLEEMIGLVNQTATSAARSEVEAARAKTRPAAAAPSGAAGLAAGLFARFSRR